ncbi:hypothetical protein OPV22_004831 [Ensete ventricosum]|uniref:Acyl-CoA-binding domain-containing protein n=1 Tax=Ensete ventricosum TaxID=4639 RepID=A0AAV8RMT3_ENSVE|nr:hypothetical protein OPV22_004831 [Ensete ventricosum]
MRLKYFSWNSLASTLEQQISGRKSLSDDPSVSTDISCRKQFRQDQDFGLATKVQRPLEDEKKKNVFGNGQRSKRQQQPEAKTDVEGGGLEKMDVGSGGTTRLLLLHFGGGSNQHISRVYEAKTARLTRKNCYAGRRVKKLHGQVERENAETTERKLADALREVELLKHKLAAGIELVAQEEANSLSNMVHSDNVRLEHDVAFLKAILEDTHKEELHSTRGVLAGERARAFQLKVQVFHLKQRLQSGGGGNQRAPTPRKPSFQ